MAILVLQSSWSGRESWLLCLVCLPDVSWWLCGSSLWCHGFVCGLWLWYFLIILTIFATKRAELFISCLFENLIQVVSHWSFSHSNTESSFKQYFIQIVAYRRMLQWQYIQELTVSFELICKPKMKVVMHHAAYHQYRPCLLKGALAWYGKLTWESAHAWILKILCYLIVWGITLIFMVRLSFYEIPLLLYDVTNDITIIP